MHCSINQSHACICSGVSVELQFFPVFSFFLGRSKRKKKRNRVFFILYFNFFFFSSLSLSEIKFPSLNFKH